MSKTVYAVWGRDKAYRWLWLASLVAGWDAAKRRYQKRTAGDSRIDRQSPSSTDSTEALARKRGSW